MRKSALFLFTLFALYSLLPPGATAEQRFKQEKRQKDVINPVPLPEEPPAAVAASTSHLSFDVSPLTTKGLLSEQVRNALKAIQRQSRGGSIIKLRAFVAGSGDIRRVQAIVSAVFTERRVPLPVLPIIQVGGLPVAGAPVVIESCSVSRKAQNPNGLAFISGQAATSEEIVLDVAPLARKSIGKLAEAVRAAGAERDDVLRATCFLSSLQDINAVRSVAMTQFPRAKWNFVQTLRAQSRSLVECEAIARLRTPVGEPLRFLNPPELPQSPNYSQVALVGARQVVFSGGRLAFRFQADDVRLAFQRLGRDLAQKGASLKNVAMASVYPLSDAVADLVRKVRFEFYDKDRPPASTMLPFEGLPGLDASLVLEAVAVLPNSR